MKFISYAATVGAAVLSASMASAAPALVDAFESANLSAPSGPSPAINTYGFTWAGTNKTSIVTMLNGVATSVWNGATTNTQVAGGDYSCYDGKYCLRFTYPAGNYMAEQRFDLGHAYPEVWVRYWLRVPKNFYHGSQNNKFAAFWTNVYDGPGEVTWQTRPTTGGGAMLVVQDGGVAQSEYPAVQNFISVPGDRGRWMQVVIRMIPATASGANNGTIQFYRRWSNETSFSLLYSKTNARFYEGGKGVKAGYLFGWANDPYSELTEWLVDKFTVSPDSLLDDASTSTPASGDSAPPSPPVLNINGG